ncbi:thiol reductant ABC exporter subunit CydC [Leucobacter sp. UCMA 4100]|uniref:thiol reductant ABC exporter subunit CydC n=1 Tax=Leucobacter sp. UCMA 4100 TaxID=2810534 RepID=UPI0022EB6660|nr:thiol reductant ABC exporter subunit CydC [Leucobacter sp. UCMA 4100]MDA3145936.1 thiol reductant ABC exporter subunit CydC [Leucobacter sp. UCMA 4100]
MTKQTHSAQDHFDAKALAMPAPKALFTGVFWGVLSDASMVALLILSMWLIMRSGEQPPILHLTFAIVGVRALAIGRAVFRYLERLATHDRALKQLASLRSNVLKRLIPLVPGAMKQRTTGDVHASLIDDIDQLQDQPLRVWQPLVVSGITVALGVGLVAIMSPLAALVNTVFIVLALLTARWLIVRSRKVSSSELTEIRSRLIDALIERFEAAQVLHHFGATSKHDERISRISREYVSVQQKEAGLTGMTAGLMSGAAGLSTLVTLWLMRPEAGLDVVSAPVLAALVIVPAALFEVLTQIPQAMQARQLVDESAARVESLLGERVPDEIPETTGSESETRERLAEAREAGPDSTVALLAAHDLSARYPGATRNTLEDVDFELNAGETLLITGESGAGKSTLAKVLVRFLEYEGSLTLGGTQLKHLTTHEVRSRIGLSEQSPHLFDSDLRQNLKFAQPDAPDEVLLEALDRVGLRDWAESRGGLDMHVGEHGALVSGGQASRIALARVLLTDFEIVVLDEPTAGVDTENADAMLRDLLGAVPSDRAVVVISHTDLPEGVNATRHLRLSSVGA